MVTCQRVADCSNREFGRDETALSMKSSQYRTPAQIGTLRLVEIGSVLRNAHAGLEVKRFHDREQSARGVSVNLVVEELDSTAIYSKVHCGLCCHLDGSTSWSCCDDFKHRSMTLTFPTFAY